MAVSSGGGASWASLLGDSLPTRNDKNVMEIVLEQDFKGMYNASEEEVAKVLQKLGADLRPGVHIEGVQICPLGKNVIQVTLNKNVDMSRFYNKDVLEIKEGGRISQIRQSGKREVILTIKVLHPNALDDTVFKYLCCLKKVEKKKVILDTYKEGPLCGFQNGDRKYSLEFRTDITVGPTHVIDGQKVTFSFPGQRRTCFRCFETPNLCQGRGVAKDCEAAGGVRVMLTDYMTKFWAKIKYKPDKTDLPTDLEEIEPNYQIADHGTIMEFLVQHGLTQGHGNVNIKENGQVIISELEPRVCMQMIDEINGQKFNQKNVYCHGIVPATPKKNETPALITKPVPAVKTPPGNILPLLHRLPLLLPSQLNQILQLSLQLLLSLPFLLIAKKVIR